MARYSNFKHPRSTFFDESRKNHGILRAIFRIMWMFNLMFDPIKRKKNAQ